MESVFGEQARPEYDSWCSLEAGGTPGKEVMNSTTRTEGMDVGRKGGLRGSQQQDSNQFTRFWCFGGGCFGFVFLT